MCLVLEQHREPGGRDREVERGALAAPQSDYVSNVYMALAAAASSLRSEPSCSTAIWQHSWYFSEEQGQQKDNYDFHTFLTQQIPPSSQWTQKLPAKTIN